MMKIYDNKTSSREDGFTIIELMLSTVVFSIVLLMCMAGILQITRLYYRGVTQSSTQEVARTITNEISEAVQFSNSKIYVPKADDGTDVNPFGPEIDSSAVDPDADAGVYADVGFICIGGKRYTFAMDRQLRFDNPDAELSQKSTGLWVDQPIDGCANAAVARPLDLDNRTEVEATNGSELLNENMRLTQFEISPVDTVGGSVNDNVWNIKVAVAYGDNDLLELSEDGDRRRCKPSGPGVEFCATSEISTTVRRRVQ